MKLTFGFAVPKLDAVLRQLRGARAGKSYEIQVRSSEGTLLAILSLYPIVETLTGPPDLLWLFAPERLALVLVRETASPTLSADDILRRTFGLTPAEARLANRIAGGQTLEDASDELGITKATARTQLKATMAKTNTHRQVELAMLVQRLASR